MSGARRCHLVDSLWIYVWSSLCFTLPRGVKKIKKLCLMCVEVADLKKICSRASTLIKSIRFEYVQIRAFHPPASIRFAFQAASAGGKKNAGPTLRRPPPRNLAIGNAAALAQTRVTA
jgi:hypothetical protein